MKLYLGEGLRRGERAKFIVTLCSMMALTTVLAAAQLTSSRREPTASLEQQVINARQTDMARVQEARLDKLDDQRLDVRLSVLENTVEGLVWGTRTNYVVAITLLLNLVATLYQMRQNRERRTSGRD